jgi:hypothetical protein
MMALLKLAAAGIASYFLYNAIRHRGGAAVAEPAAFAHGEEPGQNFSQVRSAGTEGMRSDPKEWDKIDQAADVSFPASDPPSTY